ncbi:MAG: G5 domain-containing protein, partial [Oscillospiraceae bacterium]
MPRLKNIICAVGEVISARIFAVAMLSLAIGFCVVNVTTRTNAVVIRDNEQSILRYTFNDNYNEILEDNGIITLAADKVAFTGMEGGYAEINISRAFPVTVSADGRTYATMITEGSVADVFDKLGVPYDSDDIVTPALDKELNSNESIKLNRVDYVTRTVEETIPYEVVTRSSSLIGSGRSKLLVGGQEGIKNMTYLERTVDGQVEDAELIGENIISPPVTKQILLGENAP